MTPSPAFRGGFWAVLVLALAACLAGASALPKDVMPLSEVRAGMKGYGLTVFRGTRIERFSVEVVSVVRRGSLVVPGHDMILVRMSGGPITARKANLIRGMSGSPVYINGRVIGAFAMGEPNSIEPLGGVTPIEDMLEAWDPRLPQVPWITRLPGEIKLPVPIRIGRRKVCRLVRGVSTGPRRMPVGSVELLPCTTILSVSGAPRRALARLADNLKPLGVEIVQGPASGASQGLRGGSLRPGAAFAMMLVTGDVTAGATGTVTYRQGNRFLGFGHPLMGLGPVSAPICTAYIHDVYPLLAGSYKISSPGPVVGASEQDRPFCVTGVAGATASMVPISVEVLDETTGRRSSFKAQCANHPNLLAANMLLAAGSAVYDVRSFPGPCMADVETNVVTEGMGTLTRRNSYYDRTGIDAVVTGDLEDLLTALTANPFRRVQVRGATMRVTLRNGRATAVVDRAFVRSGRVEPGKDLEVGLVVKPYGADPVTRVVRVPVPATAVPGRVAVEVRGGGLSAMAGFAGLTMRGATSLPSDLPPPVSAEQVVDRVLKRETAKEVVVRVLFPTTSPVVDGEPLRDLPAYLESGLRSPRVSSLATERMVARIVVPMDWITTGSQTVAATVAGQQDQPTAPAPASPGLIGTPASVSNEFAEPIGLQGRRASGPTSSNHASAAGKAAVVPGGAPVTDATSAAPTPTTPAKPEATVVRMAKTWRETAKQAVVRGELSGVALGEMGLVLSADVVRSAELSTSIAWCLLGLPDGTVLVGTGPSGTLCRVSAADRVETFARIADRHIACLCPLPDGGFAAGTLGTGLVYSVSPTGATKLLHQFSEPHVLACSVDSAGRLLVGTGGGAAALYRLESSGRWRELLRTKDRAISALVACPDGSVVAGTAGRGVVYHVSADGSATPAADLADVAVTSLVATQSGDLLAGTAPKGLLVSIKADGATTTLGEYPSARGLLLAHQPGGRFSAVSGTSCFDVVGTGIQAHSNPEGNEFVGITQSADGGLATITSNDALIYRVAMAASHGTMTSGVLDGTVKCRWGTASVVSDTPNGSSVSLSVRGGETPVPDANWSSWCPVACAPGGAPITVPNSRFLQYRLGLSPGASGTSPCVRSVALTYLPANRPPKVVFTAPAGGEVWSGRQELKWTATDPDQDALSFEVAVSRDSGRTWAQLPAAAVATPQPGPVQPTGGPKPTSTNPPATGRAQALEQVKAELDLHPDLPAALREAILARAQKLAGQTAQPGQPASAAPPAAGPASNARSSSRAVETALMPDGNAMFRVIASDRASNAEGDLSGEARTEVVTLCNTAPVLYVIGSSVKVTSDQVVSLEAVAVQSGTYITGVQFRVDNGEWSAARATAGMYSGPLERAVVQTAPLSRGKHKIEVRAYNAGGLCDTEAVDVTVP